MDMVRTHSSSILSIAVRLLIALHTNLIEFDHDHVDHIRAFIYVNSLFFLEKDYTQVFLLSFPIGLSIGFLEYGCSISTVVTYGHAHATC